MLPRLGLCKCADGNIVLMSTALVDADRSRVIKYLIPVVSFIIGIAIAEVVHMRFKTTRKSTGGS